MAMTALVVGGAGGIGRACTVALERHGWQVLVLDRALGHDATDPAALRTVVGDTPLSLVVHAAGSVGAGGIADGTPDQWRRVLEDNLVSAMVVLQGVEPLLTRGSSVVLLSSVNGRHGGNTLSGPAYAAAKAGLIGLTRNVAKEWAHRDITVNAVAPGPVRTAMLDRLATEDLDALVGTIPVGRIVEPDEIAGTVLWLAGPAARSVTGTVIDVNGGMWMG